MWVDRGVLGWVGGECVLWGEVRERAAIDVRGRERSRVLCFYGVSDSAVCRNLGGWHLLGERRADEAAVARS